MKITEIFLSAVLLLAMLVSGTTINQQKTIFRRLPIRPIPPPGPSDPPPAPYRRRETTSEQKMILGKLPKTVPIPPTGPSSRRNYPPPLPHQTKTTGVVSIPPSGPSGDPNIPPPPPPSFAG
ncbi:hypothetical protein Salat_2325000 [Sesamum alatum]|uniref:Uncharacterized protein n=1 Tax=Sesamum alatum TaxID=300844 RepID=A0AAE1XW73_9LAMI|nr:hypothetical protein Salat_2325000 [Sesamum alatum]